MMYAREWVPLKEQQIKIPGRGVGAVMRPISRPMDY